MWATIFTALNNPISGDSSFIVFLKNCLNAIMSLFIETSGTGADIVYQVTDFGYIFFAVVGIGILYGLMSWVIKLMKLKN